MKISFKTRIAATFFFVTALSSAYFFSVFYFSSISGEKERIREYLKQTAVLGAALIPGEEIQQMAVSKNCETSADYPLLLSRLQKIKNSSDRIHDVYVMVPSGKSGILKFIANALHEAEPVRCGESYNANGMRELINGLVTPDADLDPVEDRWGYSLSGYAPILNGAGKSVGLIGLDVSAHTLQEIKSQFFERFVLVLVISFAIALLLGFFMSYLLVKPLQTIVSGMQRVSEGDLQYALKSSAQEEFRKISDIFNEMVKSLRRTIEELSRSVRHQERVSRELEIAASLQSRVLPIHFPKIAGAEIAARTVQAREVGGDYYDIFELKNQVRGIAIGDAAGKGFSGALYMMNTRSVFRMASRTSDLPAEILKSVNHFLCSDPSTEGGMFMTFLFAAYDERKRTLTYSNAGHHAPILLKSGGSAQSLNLSGLPLGILEGEAYAQETAALDSGDLVLFYSDGVAEAFNAEREMFGVKRLVELCGQLRRHSASEMVEKALQEIKRFTHPEPLADDATVIVLKVL